MVWVRADQFKINRIFKKKCLRDEVSQAFALCWFLSYCVLVGFEVSIKFLLYFWFIQNIIYKKETRRQYKSSRRVYIILKKPFLYSKKSGLKLHYCYFIAVIIFCQRKINSFLTFLSLSRLFRLFCVSRNLVKIGF